VEVSTEKSKTMIISTKERKHRIAIQGQVLEHVTNYNYVGAIIEKSGKINPKNRKTGRL
jgi:hypothetical protein